MRQVRPHDGEIMKSTNKWYIERLYVPRHTTLHCDNQSAIFMSANHVSQTRSKHIALDYHFICEQVATGTLMIKFIPSHLQLVDIFTKSLSRSQFVLFCSKLTVTPSPISLRGVLRIQLLSLSYKKSQLMILNHNFYHNVNSCTISV